MLAACFTGDTEQKIRVLVQESIFELQETTASVLQVVQSEKMRVLVQSTPELQEIKLCDLYLLQVVQSKKKRVLVQSVPKLQERTASVVSYSSL